MRFRRIDAKEDLPPESVADAAKIIRDFIEDYHEKLEENFLFPRFEKAGKLVDLVTVLQEQHQAGRRVTDLTMSLANLRALKDAEDCRKLADSMRQFIRMYNPHEAREDTGARARAAPRCMPDGGGKPARRGRRSSSSVSLRLPVPTRQAALYTVCARRGPRYGAPPGGSWLSSALTSRTRVS